ncbi:helix-turn-helix domain-containing protein [Singulisphaera sp. PoT]|uniref:helix-turn-helix domain-containing protein n=1 Tax=Singulisphaera sp. PoT TaxID=3411797 RepID=UPI003BF51352
MTDATIDRETIIAIKEKLGLTFEAMGERLGVKWQAVARWVAPVESTNFRRPRGAAVKMLEEMAKEAGVMTDRKS